MKIYCDFTGIYGEDKVSAPDMAIDLSDIEGTGGYCSKEAGAEIRKRTANLPTEGIHILDNGNYHYMSLFWLEKIKEPFELVVFDHHTDMQESSLIPALSCGNWVLEVIKNGGIPVEKIYLIGPEMSDFEQVDERYKDKIVFVSRKDADRLCEDQKSALPEISTKMSDSKLPVYISVDKDVLSKKELKVNWEQGSMSADGLKSLVEMIFKTRRVIGMDLCGEPDIRENGFSREEEKSRFIDKLLIDVFDRYG